MSQDKIKEIMSKDFIKGLETGLKIATDVAKKQGYELSFPNVDDMLIEKDNDTKLEQGEQGNKE